MYVQVNRYQVDKLEEKKRMSQQHRNNVADKDGLHYRIFFYLQP